MRLITKSGTHDDHSHCLDPISTSIPPRSPASRRRSSPAPGSLRATSRDVAEPGRFLTAQVGAESVLVVRGDDGELRAFRNVCRHRAARLREGRGDCGKAIRCPYHGWTYRTDGSLIGVPEGRGFPGLDKQRARPARRPASRRSPASCS